jgi:long-chain fatty acid transport protein
MFWAGAIIISILIPLPVFAAGFLIYNQDAYANGMGMACASSIEKPAAAFFNPANLPELKGTAFTLNTTLIKPELSYTDSFSGQKKYSKSNTHTLFALYGYYTWNNKSIGIGLFSPFGLSTEWKKDFPGRYYSILSSLRTLYVNPVFAIKMNEKLKVAFGVSYVSSSVKFKNMIPTMLGVDGLSKLRGEGSGLGYNFASSLDLEEDLTFSITVRSPVRIKYEGEGRVYMPSPLPSFATDCYTYFTLPYLMVFGLSKRVKNTTLEVDVLYTGWSSMNSYRIRSENGLLDTSYHKRWGNTFTFCGGIDQKITGNLSLRAGYMYDITPVPLSTRGPELPDATRNIFTFGGSYERGNFTVSFSYQATYFKKAKSSLPGLLGYYRNFAHVGLLSLGYTK